MTIDKETQDFLAKKFEGGLFVHYWGTFSFGRFSIQKNHYTVIGGKVYSVDNGQFHPSDDQLISIESKCKKIGEYDKTKTYNMKTRFLSISEIENLLNT